MLKVKTKIILHFFLKTCEVQEVRESGIISANSEN